MQVQGCEPAYACLLGHTRLLPLRLDCVSGVELSSTSCTPRSSGAPDDRVDVLLVHNQHAFSPYITSIFLLPWKTSHPQGSRFQARYAMLTSFAKGPQLQRFRRKKLSVHCEVESSCCEGRTVYYGREKLCYKQGPLSELSACTF